MWFPTSTSDVLKMYWHMFWWKYGRWIALLCSAAFLFVFFIHC